MSHPVGVLRDPRQERFARALVEQYLKVPPVANAQLAAYKDAGYTPHRGNCQRLARRDDIRARVDELMEEALEYLDIRQAEAVVRVSRIARARKLDYFEFVETADGKRMQLRDLETLPARLTEAIADVARDPDGHPVDVVLHDKMSAALAIIKHLGGIRDPDDSKPSTSVNIWNVLSAADQLLLAEALEALERGQAGTGEGTAAPGG